MLPMRDFLAKEGVTGGNNNNNINNNNNNKTKATTIIIKTIISITRIAREASAR